jgi:hypothetical protein
MKYRIYIDETGNSDLASSDNPNHRFLGLTGVILDLEYVRNVVYPQIETLKNRYFRSHPDEPVIFHRKEMIQTKPPFEALKDPEIKRRFDFEILQLLSEWDYHVITTVIDKKTHKDTYSVWRYDAYHYCLAVLIERFIFFLEQVNSVGDVMAESRGGKSDMRLKKSFELLCNQGTDFINSDRFHKVLTSRQLKIKPKANNITGLQIADLLAHPSRTEILLQYELTNQRPAPFAEKIITILQKKYYQKEGRIIGYGLKLL